LSCSTRLASTVALLSMLGLSLAGCGGDSTPSAGTGTQPVVITIVEKNGSITPDDGRVVDASLGQDIQVVVTTDAADEIHVHSIPEHEFEVKAGADAEKLPVFSVDTPGRFVIESHGLDVTLVTLQVS
jgi:hypothetical protein